MIFLEFAALLVINVGYVIMVALLPATLVVVLGAVCVGAIMSRVHGKSR